MTNTYPVLCQLGELADKRKHTIGLHVGEYDRTTHSRPLSHLTLNMLSSTRATAPIVGGDIDKAAKKLAKLVGWPL